MYKHKNVSLNALSGKMLTQGRVGYDQSGIQQTRTG